MARVGKERVRIVRDFDLPVERVFAFLAEHENLGKIFAPVKITRVRDGVDGHRNGVGSARLLRIGPLPPVEETNTKVVENELIEYAITRGGGGLRDHWGRIVLEARDGGCRVTYTIGMNARVPGLARIVGRVLRAAISRGLGQVARLA